MLKQQRCQWCGTAEDYVDYHDKHWGVPEKDSQALFAKLILDGQQAGLSWITILRKQAAYEAEFLGLNPYLLAAIQGEERQKHIVKALQNKGIVRNKLKIHSVFKNADAYVRLEGETGRSFADIIWHFVDDQPIQNNWKTAAEVPTETEVSRALSKYLKKAGFSFVGPTIIYAYMQAVGLVNDHLTCCFRHQALKLV